MSRIMDELREECLQEGIRQGLQEIYQEEYQKGRRESSLEISRRMLKMGKFTLEEIAEFTDLPLSEVQKLQAEQTL